MSFKFAKRLKRKNQNRVLNSLNTFFKMKCIPRCEISV